MEVIKKGGFMIWFFTLVKKFLHPFVVMFEKSHNFATWLSVVIGVMILISILTNGGVTYGF
mgnify:CR=1 FL=1